jgi:hypothetical protein
MARDMDHTTTLRHMGSGTIFLIAAKNFVKTSSSLQFDVRKNRVTQISRIVVTLNANDLYDIQGYRWKSKLDLVEVDKVVDIQAENLKQALCAMVGA